MNEVSQNGPLADLERRWGDERSPQLTLHLAEEHRRLGNRARALEVLQQGLEHHPGHVAARVALGRFLFEDGQAAESIVALKSIVNDDPTHLVANKLLVSVYLEVGDEARARDRLELYKTLNAADSDIEALEGRVSELEEDVEEAEVALEAARQGGDESAVTVQPDEAVDTSRDPFGELLSSTDESRYRSALLGEGIFQLLDISEEHEIAGPDSQVAEATTVTLGRLYLEQGHAEEAERIFSAVLQKEPANADAQAGLKETQGVEKELTAANLVDAETLAGVDSAQRRRLVLESYRSRLRAASAKD